MNHEDYKDIVEGKWNHIQTETIWCILNKQSIRNAELILAALSKMLADKKEDWSK